jgi:energy-coupling factor transporter ATP-binding protein EcfA2
MTGFIELCGPPGVGKSTLARALGGRTVTLDGLRRRMLPADRVIAEVRPGLRPLAGLLAPPARVARLSALPRLCDRILRSADPSGGDARVEGLLRELASLAGPDPDDPRAGPAYRSAAFAWAERTLHLMLVAEQHPAGVLAVLDEGVVQRTVSLLGATASESVRRAALELLPTPIVVIHVTAGTELLEQRARLRQVRDRTPRLHAGLDDARVAALLAADARAIADTVGLMRNLGARVIEHRVEDASVRSSRDAVLRALRDAGPRAR